MIRAVVFDLDDTLYPEISYAEDGFRKAAAVLEGLYGVKNAYQKIRTLFDEDRQGVFDRLCRSEALPEKAVEDAVDTYRNNQPEKLEFYPKTKDVLQYLRQNGLKTGIITDGRPFSQRAKIRALGAEAYFDAIIVTDEIGREYRKPHPRAFEEMARKLNVRMEEMMYVGDNPQKDFAVKEYLPLKTVQIRTGGLYQDAEYRNDIVPDEIVADIREILELVRS